MLTSFPFMMLMFICVLLSTLMAISSSNWIFMWMSMELNMLSFIPLMLTSKSNHELEGTTKYFLIQSMGSSMLLLFSFSLWYMNLLSNSMNNLLMFSLLIKLGAAPFHFWFPQVMASLPWWNCFILSTWQKLAPLVFITEMFNNSLPLMLILIMTAFIGGVVGMNQVKLRSLMAYSSLIHLSWMLGLAYYGHMLTMWMYFTMYTIIIAPLFLLFYKLDIIYISFSFMSKTMMYTTSIIIMLLILSLSGIPPLAGFIPKWAAISCMYDMPNLLIILIMSSLMSTFYYLNMMFSSFMSYSSTPTSSYMASQLWWCMPLACMTLMLFPIVTI